MSGEWRAFVPGAGVPQGRKVYSFKESFTSAKQDRRNSDVQLVDQALAKILLNDVYTAAKTDILAFGCFASSRQGRGNAFRDEVEGRSSFHDQRCAWVVGYTAGTLEQIKITQIRQQDDTLREAEEHAKALGLRIGESLRPKGVEVDEIVRAASELAVDQIAIGTRGMGALGSFFLGSVAQRVVHLSSVPVLLVK